jgi:hypothetical protein
MRRREEEVGQLQVGRRAWEFLIEDPSLRAEIREGDEEGDERMEDRRTRLGRRFACIVLAVHIGDLALDFEGQLGVLDVLDQFKHVDLINPLPP